MGRNLQKTKGRKESFSFVMFPHRLLQYISAKDLSASACKALLFMASQYNGSNNGDLTIAWQVAKAAGIKSNGQLQSGVRELAQAGFVVQTRQGGRNRCSLFALAWFPIDHCDGKLEVPATRVAPNDWLFKSSPREPPTVQLSEPPAVQLAPPAVQS